MIGRIGEVSIISDSLDLLPLVLSVAAFFWLLFVFLLGIPQPAGFWPSLF